MRHQFIPLGKTQERKKEIYLIDLNVLLKGKLEVPTQLIKIPLKFLNLLN